MGSGCSPGLNLPEGRRGPPSSWPAAGVFYCGGLASLGSTANAAAVLGLPVA
jgi:hypothetical protein